MSDTRQARLRESLDSALANMMAVLPGADNEPGWELPTAEEGWTVRQTLAHLGSSEASMNQLIAMALAAHRTGQTMTGDALRGKDGTPFDRDRWNDRQVAKRAEQPPSALRVELTEARTLTLRNLAAQTDADLDTPAWHPALGACTVEMIYKIMGIHMKDHTRAMKAALRSSYGHYWGETEARGQE
jgi:Mycothiol maleylpyruvate isomerase N-terminal domain